MLGLFFLFPAHAGVILSPLRAWATMIAIPRTRGGDPKDGELGEFEMIYSPHTRG